MTKPIEDVELGNLYDGVWKREERDGKTFRMVRVLIYTGTSDFIRREMNERKTTVEKPLFVHDGVVREQFMRYTPDQFEHQTDDTRPWWYLPLIFAVIFAFWCLSSS